MAEEAEHPDKDVPRSMNFVIIAVLVVYIGMPLAALSAMTVGSNTVPVDPATGMTVAVEVVPGEPEGTYGLKSDPRCPRTCHSRPCRTARWSSRRRTPAQVETVDGEQVATLYGSQLGSNYKEDPVLGMVRFLPDSVGWMRWILGPWVGVLAATILFIATNAGIIGVSRLAFSLGQHRQLPRVLGRVHPTRLTPYIAIIFFGVVAVILILPGSIPLLAELYAFGSMIAFTAAHVSVVVLRFKEPDLVRPFRPPLNIPIRGTSFPITSVIGGMATFTVWLIIVYYQPQTRLIGFAWMGVGIVAYVIFRKVQGYSLTKTVKAPTLPASLQEDVVYNQLLVPVRDTLVSEEMMVLACQLATERRSSIDALYVIEVPLNLPIDASLPEERARARQVLENAAHAADMFGVKLTPVVVTARSAGRAIVEEAIARRSDVIVLGSQGKRRIADKVFGRTIDYVLNNLPCEAIINVIPKSTPGVAGVTVAASAGVISPPAPAGAGPSGERPAAAGRESTAGRVGVRRRAQRLPLSRYLPSRPGRDGSGAEADAGGGAKDPAEAASPHAGERGSE